MRSGKRISKIEAGGNLRIVLLDQTSKKQAKINSSVKNVRKSVGRSFEEISQSNLVAAMKLPIFAKFIRNFFRFVIKFFKKQPGGNLRNTKNRLYLH